MKAENWKTVRLGDVCEVVSGSTPRTDVQEFWNGNLNWITPAELSEESHFVYETERKITQLAVQKAHLSLLPKGTILLSSRAPIGKTAIAGNEMFCNQGFKNLICSEQVFNEYLFWFLRGKTDYLNSLGRGATFKEISKSIVENITIPLPPIETQKLIAAQLDKCTTIIAKHKQVLEKYDTLIKSRFIEMFDKYISTNEKVYLETICEFVTVGIANSATQAFSDEGIIMFRNQNIKEDFLDDSDIVHITETFAKKYKSKSLKENDLLIVRTGYPGIACLVPKKYEGSQTFTTLIARLINDNKINPRYICHYINSAYGKEYVDSHSAGAAQQNFGATALAKMPISLPPIYMQNEYIDFVQQIDKSKFAVQQSLEKAETLYKSLMQEYFE